ncbi:MAG: hypothetical protein ABIP51_20150 [Bacteroidia bacterium]
MKLIIDKDLLLNKLGDSNEELKEFILRNSKETPNNFFDYFLSPVKIDKGWECPNSPDGHCHYFTNDAGMVELFDEGKVVLPPAGHDKENENEDECLFCGEPEERK